MDWSDLAFRLVSPLFHPLMPSQRLFIPYVVMSIIIAILIFMALRRRHDPRADEGLIGFLFPARLWCTGSTWLNIKFFFVNKALFAVLFVHFMITLDVASNISHAAFSSFVDVPFAGSPMAVVLVVTTILSLLAHDFGLFFAHYLQHRIPFLWAFHKVHHSVSVMTPMAAFRMHPVDDFLAITLAGGLYGLAIGVCQALFGGSAHAFEWAGVHIGLFIFYLAGFHLRHSHIWLPLKGVLGHIFVSPAHHQLHHSRETRHIDKNMGFVFAFWDWLFGTLYVPEKEEKFEIGLSDGSHTAYNSIWRLYALPVKEVSGIKQADDTPSSPPPQAQQT